MRRAGVFSRSTEVRHERKDVLCRRSLREFLLHVDMWPAPMAPIELCKVPETMQIHLQKGRAA